MSKTQAPTMTPSPSQGEVKPNINAAQRSNFFGAVLDMSWKLALVVLVPVIGGAELDKALNTKPVFLFIGLGLALVGSAAVMWRSMQAANRLPVPKVSAAQKKAIQKQYEEDDD